MGLEWKLGFLSLPRICVMQDIPVWAGQI